MHADGLHGDVCVHLFVRGMHVVVQLGFQLRKRVACGCCFSV